MIDNCPSDTCFARTSRVSPPPARLAPDAPEGAQERPGAKARRLLPSPAAPIAELRYPDGVPARYCRSPVTCRPLLLETMHIIEVVIFFALLAAVSGCIAMASKFLVSLIRRNRNR